MDEQDIASEIDRIREQARQRLRRRLPIVVVITAAAVAAGVVVGFVASRGHRHHHDSSAAGIIAGAVTLLVLAAIVIVLVRQRRKGATNYWRQPSLVLGLPRGQRRQVNRDLRRGEPSPDPVLRRIEEIAAERFRRNTAVIRWIFPLLAVLNVVNGLRNIWDDNDVSAVLDFASVALFVVVAAYAFFLRRGVRAFG